MLKNIRILFRIVCFFLMALVKFGNRVALICVDLQNDFLDQDRGTLSKAAGGLVIWAINLVIWAAEKLGWLVIFTLDWHPEGTSHFKQWPVHCVANSWGAMIFPRIYIPRNAIFIYKGTKDGEDAYSGFDGRTDKGCGLTLLEVLEACKISIVVTLGAYLDFCVKATTIDAIKNCFVTYLLSFATCPVNFYTPNDGEKAIVEIKAAGGHVI